MTQQAATTTAGNGSRILVVDDELGIREGCRKILEPEGYEVETAEDGVAALELLGEPGRFAAALIDLKMPRMGGLELIEAIRKEDQDIVLLVITAFATIQTAVEAVRRGANGYIAKPFTADELVLPVQSGLQKRALELEARRLREERAKRLLEVAYERSKSRTIINCMNDGVLVVNMDRQVVLQNAAAIRLFPEGRTLFMPTPLEAMTCPELKEVLEQTLAERGPVISTKEITIGPSTYMVNASAVLEQGGETVGVVAVIRDITELKKMSLAKSTFVSMIAHELRSPLAAIQGLLQLVVEGIVGGKAEEAEALMNKCVVRCDTLRSMVAELMDLVAMETGQFSLKRSPVDICGVVEEVVESLRAKAEEKNIELIFRCEGEKGPSIVLADRNAVRCVFTNLADNAVKYTHEGGRVEVVVERDGYLVTVTVTDDGIGMTPQQQEKAFDEFYRAKNEKTLRIPGTGLGLSVVKKLVDMHGGRITVHSTPGEGSVFSVYLQVEER